MSEEKSDYMLLFRGTNWDKGLSPEQVQKVVTDWYSWFNGLMQDGRAIDGRPLVEEGRIVSGKKGRSVADGPFAESKEAIGGYFYLRVSNLEEAVQIAQQCPALEYGAQVEVRPVAPMCTVKQRMEQMQGVPHREQLAVA
jgi:hypothetical protein